MGVWRTGSTKTSDTSSDSDEDDIEQPPTFADVFAEAEALMARLHGKDLTKIKVLTVENAAKVVSKALDVLAATWPILGGVRAGVEIANVIIQANSKDKIHERVAGLKLMQADLICSLFRLKDLKVDQAQSFYVELKGICNMIKEDVTYLGNLVKNYVAESALGRALKEGGWKAAITKGGNRVAGCKERINTFLVNFNAAEVSRIAIGMDKLLALFARTEQEQRVHEQVGDQVDVSTLDETTLNKLYLLLCQDGEASSERGIKRIEKKVQLSPADIRRIRTPVDKILLESFVRFEKKIDVLIKETTRYQDALKMIMSFTSRLPYDRIVHPDIKKLWSEMGWGGSVDAHVFVLNLFDYFIDLEREFRAKSDSPAGSQSGPDVTTLDGTSTACAPLQIDTATPQDADAEPSHPPPTVNSKEGAACTTPEEASRDAWCLDYFNYRTLSTLIEVLDEDMNGLIKIKEVNEFTNAMPNGVPLMQWTVYCAYGWILSAHIYRLRIECIMEDMVATTWAKENSRAVSRYLSCLQWVVAFLRPLQVPDLQDQESLLKVTRKVMDHQEQKLKKTLLEPMDYELEDEVIRSIMKLSAQRGRGGIMNRIEGWILPVLFIVMQYHHGLMTLSQTYIMDEDVFERAYHTVDCLTDLLFERAHHLSTRFPDLAQDGDPKSRQIANGMFRSVCKYLKDRTAEQWHLPWQSHNNRTLSIELSNIDPGFSMRSLRYITSESHPFARQLTQHRTTKIYNVDEHYEEISKHRQDYGISLASTATVDIHPASDSDSDSDATTVDTEPQGDGNTSGSEIHDWVQCDGCMMSPIIGPRFHCIDCDNFDYCLGCLPKRPPPLLHPSAIAGHHIAAHRFLRIERDCDSDVIAMVVSSLKKTPFDAVEHQELGKFDPFIKHCLSADEDAVQQVRRAFSGYRREYLEAHFEMASDTESNAEEKTEEPDALATILELLSSFLPADEFEHSQEELSRMEDGRTQSHRCACNLCSPSWFREIVGLRYKCVDCDDFDLCATCFASDWGNHAQGNLKPHRALLLRYPTPMIIVERILAKIKGMSGRSREDPWWLDSRLLVLADAVPQQEGESNNEDGVDRDQETTPTGHATLRCGWCESSLLGAKGIFKCLSCKLFHDQDDPPLCSECANTVRGFHCATHVLAVVCPEFASAAEEDDDVCSHISETSKHTTVDNLSKRIDKIEASIDRLVKLVEELPFRVREGEVGILAQDI